MEITIKIEAPALTEAIQALAAATASNIELLIDLVRVSDGKFVLQPSPDLEQPQQPAPEVAPADPEPVSEPEPTPAAPPEEAPPTVTLEQVRAKLADLSRNGKQAQVKELINQYGKKLTEIPPEKFAEVLAAAEAL